ncbi:MAG: amidohydrolase family protein [Pseudomonadales bacterium]|nr:amidohydrolase family protein [Pseudomonadales bacterium]
MADENTGDLKVNNPFAVEPAWLEKVKEDIVDPDRVIIDTHHHLWEPGGLIEYSLEDLWADTGSGHKVEKTVFMECGACYHEDGPEHLRSLGEVEYVTAIAERTAKDTSGNAEIAAMVTTFDLRHDDVEGLVQRHEETSKGRFRGIRQALASAKPNEGIMLEAAGPKDLYKDPDFIRGMKALGKKGHSYDSWHYHYQNPEFAALARSAPDTTMVLDHFGTPLGVGVYGDKRDAVFQQWKKDIAEIAKCENTVAKLGGFAMPDNGMGWNGRDLPPTSDEFFDAQAAYYLHMIECFTPDRCMFESNFPVDKLSLSYHVFWNGVKKIVKGFSENEKNAMFSGTATRVYRL